MKKIGLIIGLLTLMSSSVFAQTKGRQVNLKEVKGLSMAHMTSKGQTLANDNNRMYSAVLNKLGKARAKKDSSKVNCLLNLVPAMKGLVRIGQQSLLNLKELSATGDRRDAESQFVKLVISHRKMLEMSNTAQQCGSVNMEQVFEKGVHVEKDILPGAPSNDVVDKANRLTYQVDPFNQSVLSSPDRFVLVDQGNVVPATDFY